MYRMTPKLPYIRFVLPNGLPVILYPMPSVRSIFALLYVRVGAVYESPKLKGLSHFTEHTCFLGTKKYPTPLKLSQTEENYGASFNGSCDRFSTSYWIRFPSNNFQTCLNLLHELVFEPILETKRVSNERSVVMSEFNDFWHDPDQRFAYEVWQRRFRIKDHPYGWRALGVPETIEKLNKESVISWREKYYQPSNMVLVMAGNLNAKNAEKMIGKVFAGKQGGQKASEPKFASDDYSGFSFYHQKEDRPQIRFSFSFPAFGWREVTRKKEMALGILSHLFGGGSASRLFQRLREKEKFVYHISSYSHLVGWMGEFGISGSVPVEKLWPAMTAIKEEIEKLVKNGLGDKEIRIAKNYLAASALMRFDNPESIANSLAGQEFDEEEIWLPERFIEEGKKITRVELNNLAREVFDFRRINIGLLGEIPVETLKDVKKIFVV